MNKPIYYTEYAKNRIKIICTPEYFANTLDHTKLNTKHHFIQIINPKKYINIPISLSSTIQLSFANTITGPVISIPIHHITFGKNSTIFIYPESKHIIPIFKSATFWQIEIFSPATDLFIITAPKKPKITTIS